jgi:hypothetical protein
VTPPKPDTRSVFERFPADWSNYVWPHFIPPKLRDRIATRWGPKYTESPRTYHANAEDLSMPDNGDEVTFAKFPVDRASPEVSGRYVHFAGRNGFVVDREGRVYEVRVPLTFAKVRNKSAPLPSPGSDAS